MRIFDFHHNGRTSYGFSNGQAVSFFNAVIESEANGRHRSLCWRERPVLSRCWSNDDDAVTGSIFAPRTPGSVAL